MRLTALFHCEEMLAGQDGFFRLKGQYFVASTSGKSERSELFELFAGYDPEGGPKSIAAARGQVILDLARDIARKGLR